MILNKKFYFKNKLLDFHIKILFIDVKFYLNGFISIILSFFRLYNYTSLRNLIKKNNSEKILIIELNNFHSEIFPSWLFYLKNLGYDNKIVFLASRDIHKSNPFLFLENNLNTNYAFYAMDPRIILQTYNLGFFRKFKKVIFNSEIFYFSPIDHYTHLLDILTNKKNLKNSIFLSHNTLQTMTTKNNHIDKKRQVLTLSPKISEDVKIDYIMPLINNNCESEHILKKTTFEKSKIFASCGNIKINCKDSEGLISALEKTLDTNKTINIIGKIPKKLINNKSINCYPKLSFLELKSILEKSHFILFLLREDISYQYKFNNFSGTLPLALNFNLIPIIEESFAKFYLLDDTNAIIYKNGELDKAILRACLIEYNEYVLMQKELNKIKQKIRIESLKNLKKTLGDN